MLPDRVIERGWIAVADGTIADFGEGAHCGPVDRCSAATIMLPGLVELHTDHLEAHYRAAPEGALGRRARPCLPMTGRSRRPASPRVLRFAAGRRADGPRRACRRRCHARGGDRGPRARPTCCARTISCICAAKSPIAESWTRRPSTDRAAGVRLISLMDHTPGQRQFRDEGKLRDYYRGKGAGTTDAELDVFVRASAWTCRRAYAATQHRAALVALAHRHGIPLASHDDTTREHVAEAVDDRVAIAEFPTTHRGRAGPARRPASAS